MVKSEAKTIPHMAAGAKPGPYLDRLALAIPPLHAVAIPTHPGDARFYTCAVEGLPGPSKLSPGCLFMP